MNQGLQWGNPSGGQGLNWGSSFGNTQSTTSGAMVLSDGGQSPPPPNLGLVWGSPSRSNYYVHSHGAEMVNAARDGGALDPKGDQELLARVKKIADASINQIIENRRKIDAAIETFIKESDKINGKFANMANHLMDDLSRNIEVTQARASNVSFAETVAKQVANRFAETARQLIDLQKLNHEGKLGDCKGVVDLLFYARMKEIELLNSRLDLLQKQENHELQMMIALQNEQLKVEAQRFDQMLQVSNFLSKEDQRYFENSLNSRKQKHEEEVDLLKLVQEDKKMDLENERENKKIDNEFTIDQLKEKNKKEIEAYRIKSDQKMKLAEISSNERCKVVETLANIAKPSVCSVM